MLAVSNLTKHFPGANAPLFEGVSFSVNGGERVGLIGPNGCGKSTLLRIVVGQEIADRGSVQFTPSTLRIGYLAQGAEWPSNTLIRDVIRPHDRDLQHIEAKVAQLAEALADTIPEQRSTREIAYAAALDELVRLTSDSSNDRGERVLAALGLGDLPHDQPVGALSGGQKTRLGLAALLVADPQLLILDEPTNHLDVSALEWLEAWLQTFPGGVLVVSHDRTFLDRTVTRLVALDSKTHRARVFEGNYSDYVRTVQSELDKHWATWRDQQIETERLGRAAHHTMAMAVNRENATNDSKERRYAKKVAKRAKSIERRLERYLESDERVEKPAQSWGLKLDFDELPTTGQDVLFLENASVGYDSVAPLLHDLNLALAVGERVAVIGPNGHGKSTLIKTIVGALPPLAGRVRVGASVKIGYLAQEQDILDANSDAYRTLAQAVPTWTTTEARSFLHYFLFTGDDVFRPVADLSFGERARLMLALLVAHGANLLVLDEPINHLDVAGREQFEQALSGFRGSVLAVVHDRYFVDRFATTIWEVWDGHLRVQ